MSVIAVVSLLGGIDVYMRTEVASEGSNLFTIQRVNFFQAIEDFESFMDKLMYNPKLTRDDAASLRESLQLAKYVNARAEAGGTNVSALGKAVEVTVAGSEAYYPFVSDLPLSSGRHLTAIDDRENAQVAVLGWDVFTGLFAPRDAVGATVRVGNRHFRVVGVAAQRDRVLGQSRDRFVVVPLGAFRKVFGPNQSVEIQVVAHDVRELEDAMEEATVAMRIRHGLGPRDENDFAVSSSEQLINLWKSISRGVIRRWWRWSAFPCWSAVSCS
jgi:putative ABC transport system permease protein